MDCWESMLPVLCPFWEGLDGFPEEVAFEQISEGCSAGPGVRKVWRTLALSLFLDLCAPTAPALSLLPGCGLLLEKLRHPPHLPTLPPEVPSHGLRVPAPLTFFAYPSLPFSTPPFSSTGDATCLFASFTCQRQETNKAPSILILRPTQEASLLPSLAISAELSTQSARLLTPHHNLALPPPLVTTRLLPRFRMTSLSRNWGNAFLFSISWLPDSI